MLNLCNAEDAAAEAATSSSLIDPDAFAVVHSLVDTVADAIEGEWPSRLL